MNRWLAVALGAFPGADGDLQLAGHALPVRALATAVGLVLLAALLRRFQPRRRRRIKHTLILFGLNLVHGLIAVLLDRLGATHWSAIASSLSEFFATVTILNLGVVLVFDLLVPAVTADVPSIVADLVIGAGYLVAAFHALHEAEVNLSSLIATSAVISGVLGLSLAPTIGNILGGVALQLDNSIHVGDWVQLDANTQGKVKEIRWRHTVVETRNWDTVIVPNSVLLAGNIMILGKRSEQPVQRRYWVYFNVDFRYAPSDVIAVVNTALQSSPIPNVAHDPKPHCICFDFARDGRDSFAYYAARYWLTDLAQDDGTNSAVRERLYAALHRAGIPLAVPAATVFVSNDDEEHKRRKVEREHARRIELLAEVALFKDFTREELDQLATHCVPAPFARGEVMTEQGRTAHYLYILAHGEARVTVHVGGTPEREVNTLRAPDVFGEFGVMTGNAREATVTATCPSECLRLDKAAFQEIITRRPELAERLSEVMATRGAQLAMIRENLTAEQMRNTQEKERKRLLNEIERFFGLAEEPRSSA
ncbi:MAG: mechanosensitive ion channel family protein [Deltaproteobacteria bacterium]|nr:mechanosensitive ion channel family protein [Deltaproteobacteria bacterium]